MTSSPLENSEFQSLLKEYQNSIPQKISDLRILIEKIQTSFDLKDVEKLRFFIHKLAGSAGTYGYTQVSDLCKQFENDLRQHLSSDWANSPPDPEWLSSLSSILIKINKGFKQNV